MAKKRELSGLSKEVVGAQLRAARVARGLTQAEVAKAIGTHFTVVSAVERGVRALTLQQLVRLNAAFGLSADTLLRTLQKPQEPNRHDRQVLRRIQRIRELPAREQRTVLHVLETFLKTHG